MEQYNCEGSDASPTLSNEIVSSNSIFCLIVVIVSALVLIHANNCRLYFGNITLRYLHVVSPSVFVDTK